ncbi:polysaccharide biosynthesis tyrosine autokinase [Flavobacterium johnsoniae]|uniref:exopolysaccharide transport family protein n=1 Tax=Flavobacterium johnsoniae TaxID=986 RepID=UPI0025AEF2CD|nr:tyrosine-protein kinase [Flavobacterium johnsoniae]WJS94208.1 polysaccharide biosynthesis tyrosine autokinase [Flavobacterium johnsoniae]
MDFKKELLKYLRYWPWFVLSLIVFVGAAFIFIKITPSTYETSATILFDKKQEDKTKIITISTAEKSSEDNLEDEIRLITSNEFLLDVVKKLNLNFSYFEKVYTVQNNNVNEVPFALIPTVSKDSLPEVTYEIKVIRDGFTVTNPQTEQTYNVKGYASNEKVEGLPFKIQLSAKAKKNPTLYFENEYKVVIQPTAIALKDLKESLFVAADEKAKGVIELSHVSVSPDRSRKILSEIIVLLDKSIVLNKQKVFRNTVSYLNQRIKNFTKEKDSIESVKEKYLQNNDIAVMDNYVVEQTADRTQKKESSSQNEKQISLANFALNDIKRAAPTQTLGTGYNLDSQSVNQMLISYNAKIMDSQMILERAQKNNPAYISLMTQLRVQKQELINTLEGYLNFLNQNSRANRAEQSIAEAKVKSIPTQDKVLGNINSNLSLKEETYVALLQKKEEAVLNGAILESNLKTLNAPETNYSAIFPQPKVFMLGSFMFALLLPFGITYLRLYFDTKIHNEDDIEKVLSNIPILGHIPQIKSNDKLDNTATSRSMIAEASRALVSNVSYLLPRKKESKGNVILYTSAIQGEGKSFCAFHNAITISNLNKKVLLIGVDLRNPQLHDYFSIDRRASGLSDFLANKTDDWKEFLQKDNNFSESLDVLFAGETPPNPSQLITNSNFETLIEEAREIYDYIILDTAPVQIVSDTLNFSHLADVTVFVVKYDYTDKSNLVQASNLIKKEQLKNVGILINGVNMKTAYGYGYGASYGYKYQEAQAKRPWYKKGLRVKEA